MLTVTILYLRIYVTGFWKYLGLLPSADECHAFLSDVTLLGEHAREFLLDLLDA